jgi:alpha-tubulin suppressor-like RCC1 family protein
MNKTVTLTLFALASATALRSQTFSSGYALSTRLCNGAVYITGSNSYGQAGNGSTGGINKVPTLVTSLNANVIALSGGGSHVLALMNDGTVWAWGWNNFGQLGNGSLTDSDVPLQVSGLNGVAKIYAGSNHNMALLSNGTVYTWGSNGSGQLGNNSTTNSKTAIQVASLSNVSQIAAGRYHCMALKTDGTLWTWGSNVYGQLGNGTTTQSKVPVQINLSNVTQIACGEEQSLALKSDGTVWAWGYNNYGQLGNGTTVQSNVPVQVSGLMGITDISTLLGDHCIALKNDGTVWTWGYNYYGQLGNNSSITSTIPVQVTGLTGVIDVEAGGNHCHAMKADGSIWGWGANVNGELGDGTSTSKKLPVYVGTICDFKVGIDDSFLSEGFKIFPNPAQDKLFVTTEENGSLEMYDQIGRLVKQLEISSGTNEINVQTLPGGLYELRVNCGVNHLSTKLIKVE